MSQVDNKQSGPHETSPNRTGTDPFPGTKAMPELDAAREGARRRLRDVLTRDGVDAAHVDDLLRQDRDRRWSAAAAFAKASSPRRDAASAALAASTTALHRRLDTLVNAAGPVRRFLLDVADDITATPRLGLLETHRGPVPDNNWAKFVYDVEDHVNAFHVGGDEVTFGFTWRNDGPGAVSADVHGYLVLNGTGVTLCDGGWIAFTSSRLRLEPSMVLRELWNNPPSEPPVQDGQLAVALDISCENGGFIEPGGIAGEDIFRGFDLAHVGEVVPPGGTLRIELNLGAFFNIVEGGRVQASFATGPRRVLSPGVLIVASDL